MIGDESIKFLHKMNTLQHFNLQMTKLTWKGVQVLSEGTFPSLQNLDLGEEYLTQVETIRSEIREWSISTSSPHSANSVSPLPTSPTKEWKSSVWADSSTSNDSSSVHVQISRLEQDWRRRHIVFGKIPLA